MSAAEQAHWQLQQYQNDFLQPAKYNKRSLHDVEEKRTKIRTIFFL